MLDVTTFYQERFGRCTENIDCGQLNIPSDCASQWTFVFHVKTSMWQRSLSRIFMLVSEYHNFDMKGNHARILSNILINNFCKQFTSRCTKESSLKDIIKLLFFCHKNFKYLQQMSLSFTNSNFLGKK